MDDVRQVAGSFSLERSASEQRGLRDQEGYPNLPRIERRMQLDGQLARVVEAEIIPRLMLAHRADPRPSRPAVLPTSQQIAEFAILVLGPECTDVEDRIDALIKDGLALDSLLLDLLAPTARHLGVLWDEDLCDFADLTIAMGRLQRIMHDLTARFRGGTAPHPEGRSILLIPCPGETHSFGLSLIERFFCDAGWDVTSTSRDPTCDALRLAQAGWFDVIGVSLGCETLLPTLTRTVADLRRASRNAAVRVIVGGPIFTDNPHFSTLVGADATAGDARLAITIAESLLDPRARPC